MVSLQNFQNALKYKIAELEEEPIEIQMLQEYNAVNFLGFVSPQLEPQQKYELPYHIAFCLVLNGKAKWSENRESKSHILNKLVNLFGAEQRSKQILKLDSTGLGFLLILLKELQHTDKTKVYDEKIRLELKNLITQRIKKILTKYEIEPHKNIKSRLDPLEDLFFEHIDQVVKIYENFVFSFDQPE